MSEAPAAERSGCYREDAVAQAVGRDSTYVLPPANGLAARGASATTAALWGVWAHGGAGRALARRMGAVGFLARELLAEVPPLLN
jgi:hypothetical protein